MYIYSPAPGRIQDAAGWDIYIFSLLFYMVNVYFDYTYLLVVPHKAVAEVSEIGNL